MLKNNKYYYEDCYMYFAFNGVHSSVYNLFIINPKGMTIENSVNESSEFVSAMFQEGSYYTGTQKTQKTFKRKCAAEGLTLSQYKKMMKWLTVGTTGFLNFDSNPYWGWNTVLSEVSDTNFVVQGNSLVVEFELTFQTIGTYLACNNYLGAYNFIDAQYNISNGSLCNGIYNTSMACNQYGIPVLYCENQGSVDNRKDVIFVQSVNNEYQILNWHGNIADINLESDVAITHNDVNYIHTALYGKGESVILSYYGGLHFMLGNNIAIELNSQIKTHTQSDNMLYMPSIEPAEVHNFKVDNGILYLSKLDLLTLTMNNYNYICFTKIVQSSDAKFGEEWNKGLNSVQYNTVLFFLSSEQEPINSQFSIDHPLANEADYAEIYINSGFQLNTEENDYYNNSAQYVNSTNDIGATLEKTFDAIDNSVKFRHEQFSNENDWSSYKCYMGRTNIIQISSTNITPDTVEVISYNNL